MRELVGKGVEKPLSGGDVVKRGVAGNFNEKNPKIVILILRNNYLNIVIII